MKLLVGLGNPGEKYQNTYHNVGFMYLDRLTQGHSWEGKKQFFGLICKIGDTIYLKPTTYMNDSGKSVAAVVQFYNLQPDDVTIVHDDSDLAFGVIKEQTGRGSAGHRGVKSVINHIGQDIHRIRIGIRSEKFKDMKAEEFVLRKMSKEEKQQIFANIN